LKDQKPTWHDAWRVNTEPTEGNDACLICRMADWLQLRILRVMAAVQRDCSKLRYRVV
jgi:hypothetical protein